MDVGGLETVEGRRKLARRLFKEEGGKKRVGSGYTVMVAVGWDKREDLFRELVSILKAEDIPVPGWERDGVFSTCLQGDRLFFLNTTDRAVLQRVFYPGKGEFDVEVPAATIHLVPMQ